jgi:hypothetical protein
MLSIGVRGGGQMHVPTVADGAVSALKPGIGGIGSLDLRYTYYGSMAPQAEIGLGIGAGFGYGTAGMKGTHTDQYTNTDYLGNTIDYTIMSDFTQRDQFAKLDMSLLVAMRFSGVTVNIGPRFMMPLAQKGKLTVNEATIDAYYPLYDVHVVNQQITGYLPTPYTDKRSSDIARYHLLLTAEIGYEWRLAEQHALGVQLFAEVGVWHSKTTRPQAAEPLIQVAPIADASQPVPAVEVGSVEPLVSGRRYIGFGLRAYYAFDFTSSRDTRSNPSYDSRLHHNRYLWH